MECPSFLAAVFTVFCCGMAAGRRGMAAGRRWSVKHSTWSFLLQAFYMAGVACKSQPKSNFRAWIRYIWECIFMP